MYFHFCSQEKYIVTRTKYFKVKSPFLHDIDIKYPYRNDDDFSMEKNELFKYVWHQ